jgi:hypothetical protein
VGPVFKVAEIDARERHHFSAGAAAGLFVNRRGRVMDDADLIFEPFDEARRALLSGCGRP